MNKRKKMISFTLKWKKEIRWNENPLVVVQKYTLDENEKQRDRNRIFSRCGVASRLFQFKFDPLVILKDKTIKHEFDYKG
jgi:hypothetical protein